MENVDKELLKEIADMEETPQGAYNIRKNGQGNRKKSNRQCKYCN